MQTSVQARPSSEAGRHTLPPISPLPRIPDVVPQLRYLRELAMPVALAEALEARSIFSHRGLAKTSLIDARRARIAGLHMLPPDVPLRGGLVVDVGANEGTFVAAVLALAPEARVLAVEPTELPLRTLRARFGSHPNVTIVPQALAAEVGTARMHVTVGHTGSSLHRPQPDMGELYGAVEGWKVAEEIDVPTTTLDELVGDREIAVLKIDVQGGELDVLAGGEQALRRTHAILIEIVFRSHYEGDAPFGVLHERLRERGFELRDVSDLYRRADGTAMYGDACFARA